jgi:tetratricopeptide (TPR) repeat protein
MRPLAVVALLALGAWAGAASAHGDVHARIEALTAELSERPADARRWLDRGSALGLDEDWEQAARDFEQALALLPRDADAARRLANARLRLGEPEDAAALMDPVVAANGADAEARLLRARARRELGRSGEAADDYAAAILAYPSPAPHLYLERADNDLERGRADEAIAGLRAGIARVGPIVTLVERVAELQRAEGDAAGAAQTLGALPDEVRSSPRTLLMKARYLAEAGDEREAALLLDRASETIRALPESRRESAAMRALSDEVLAARSRLVPEADAVSPSRAWGARAVGGLALAAVAIFAALGALARAPHSVRRSRGLRRAT